MLYDYDGNCTIYSQTLKKSFIPKMNGNITVASGGNNISNLHLEHNFNEIFFFLLIYCVRNGVGVSVILPVHWPATFICHSAEIQINWITFQYIDFFFSICSHWFSTHCSIEKQYVRRR